MLIIDEAGFSRVCFAIFELEGLVAEVVDTRLAAGEFKWDGLDLVITSYPYGTFIFDKLRERRVPIMVLSEHINEDLIGTLDRFDNAYCMVKPIDYQKFIAIIKGVLTKDAAIPGGLKIV
jgi:hypothetical protein